MFENNNGYTLEVGLKVEKFSLEMASIYGGVINDFILAENETLKGIKKNYETFYSFSENLANCIPFDDINKIDISSICDISKIDLQDNKSVKKLNKELKVLIELYLNEYPLMKDQQEQMNEIVDLMLPTSIIQKMFVKKKRGELEHKLNRVIVDLDDDIRYINSSIRDIRKKIGDEIISSQLNIDKVLAEYLVGNKKLTKNMSVVASRLNHLSKENGALYMLIDALNMQTYLTENKDLELGKSYFVYPKNHLLNNTWKLWQKSKGDISYAIADNMKLIDGEKYPVEIKDVEFLKKLFELGKSLGGVLTDTYTLLKENKNEILELYKMKPEKITEVTNAIKTALLQGNMVSFINSSIVIDTTDLKSFFENEISPELNKKAKPKM